MAYRFQFRRDTEENFKDVILAHGEIGLIIRNNIITNLYKVGDGVTKFSDLKLFGFNGTLSNLTPGLTDSNEAVSKDVLIARFGDIDTSIEDLDDLISEISKQINGEEGGDTPGLLSRVEELEGLPEIVDAHDVDIENLNKEVFGQAAGEGTEEYEGLTSRVNTLESVSGSVETEIDKDVDNKIQSKFSVMSQTLFDTYKDEMVEGMFYFVYDDSSE